MIFGLSRASQDLRTAEGLLANVFTLLFFQVKSSIEIALQISYLCVKASLWLQFQLKGVLLPC